MKNKTIDEICVFLLRKGFLVKALNYCFDVLARKGPEILLIKVLEDANALNKEYINEMENIASFINGKPVIIAEKSGNKLEDNVVYSRFNVNTLNTLTFKNAINNKNMFIRSKRAGLTVEIDSDKLKKIADDEGLSLNSLAKKVGVSIQMIRRYETGEAEVSIEKAARFYDIFGEKVFKAVKIFTSTNMENKYNSEFSKKYKNLGFNTAETKKVPFDIIAKKENEIILTKIGDKVDKNLDAVSKLIEADDLVIFNKNKPKDIPSLKKDEFLELKKAKELLKIIKGN